MKWLSIQLQPELCGAMKAKLQLFEPVPQTAGVTAFWIILAVPGVVIVLLLVVQAVQERNRKRNRQASV